MDDRLPGLRERKKAMTRLLLRERALDLFRAHGYEETTVAQIAAAADVSEPTFFRYYPSKVAVALAPLSDAIDLALAAVEERPADEPPLTACLAVAGAAKAAGLAPRPGAARAPVPTRQRPLRSGVVQLFDDAADRLTVGFTARLGAGSEGPVARQTAMAVMATVLAVFRHWVDEPDAGDIAEAVEDGLLRLRHGLR